MLASGDMPRFLPLLLVALSSCQGREQVDASPAAQNSAAKPPARPTAAVPSSSSSAPASAATAVPGVPFEVRPAAQVKHVIALRDSVSVNAEPGVMLGPKRTFVKAFDCTSRGAPKRDMIGVCVAFKSCEAAQPARPEVLAAIRCTGPALTLELTQAGAGLVFGIAEPDHPLGKRPMTPIALPEGTRAEVLPFERRNLTTYVDI